MENQVVSKITVGEATQTQRPRILSYRRVSTNNQKEDGLSIETQGELISRKVQEMGGELVEIYTDEGRSGTTMNRPGLMSMLERCKKGDITHIIVQDTSRLSRSLADYLLIKQIIKDLNIEVIALSGMAYFGDDPNMQAFDEVTAIFNSLQPRISGYKAKLNAIEKFKAGYYPSYAPLGYRNVVNTNPTGSYDKRIIVPDPDTSPFIKQAFKMYSSANQSIISIRQYLYSNGIRGKKGRALQFSVTHGMLKNPFYMGIMRWGGMEGPGKHEPLVSETVFKRIQEILEGRSGHGIRSRKHNFLLRGVIFCKCCGKRFVGESHKIRSNGKYVSYYHCTQVGKRGRCPSAYVNLKDLEKQVEELVSKLEFSEEFIETVKRNVVAVYQDSLSKIKLLRKAVYNRRDSVEIKREKLEEQLLLGIVGGDAYKRMNTKLETELLEVQKELAGIEKIKTVDTGIVDKVLDLTRNLAKAYVQADTDKKRACLHFFFKNIWIENEQIVDVEYTPAIQALKKASEKPLVQLRSVWLPLWDAIRMVEVLYTRSPQLSIKVV